MPKRVFVYGGNAASSLVNTYSEDTVRTGFVARQSLISAMSRPARLRLDFPPGTTVSASRLVLEDAASSLMVNLEKSAPHTDLVFWDLDDERFGVNEMEDGSYVTRSPVFARTTVSGPDTLRHIEFGSEEHFAMWAAAAAEFVQRLKDLGVISRTFVIRLPWAAADEAGISVELGFGPGSARMNALFQPYYEHLSGLGLRVIEAPGTTGASSHPAGRSPLHLRDECYHTVLRQLADELTDAGIPSSSGCWNWDGRHEAQVLRWSQPEQVDASLPGRTAHFVAPRRASAEKFPARFLVQNTGSDTLLVVSHGSLPRGKYQTPRFEWLATLQHRAENLLFLADGALETHPELELAWFTGDAEDNLTARFSSIVQTVARQLDAKHVLFIGGSGGGFASLALAAALPGSRALVFNPQTAIRKYWNKSVSTYQRTLFPALDSTAQLDSYGPRMSAVARVAKQQPEDYQIVYVQNDDDGFHMDNHLGPFARALGMNAETSVSADGNVQLIIERFADGHNMPYRHVLNPLVDLALKDWGYPLQAWPRTEYSHLLSETGA